MDITLLFYRTEHPGNLGSIARACENFGFENIVLIEPQFDPLCEEARLMAKHAQKTLERMRVADESVIEEFDTLVATHGRESSEYNLKRAMLTPRALRERIEGIEDGSIGILFGPEGEGLSPQMLGRADIALSIPTMREYSSMNLAMSVAVMLYELSLGTQEGKVTEVFAPMTKTQRDILMGLVEDNLSAMTFPSEPARETMRVVWRRMLGRSFLTQREAQAMMGFLKRTQGKR